MVVPTAVVLIYSATVEPIYYPRYLILTAPGAAVILAICIVSVARKPWLIAGAVAVFAAAAFPNYYFTQRGPYAKEGWDYSQVADVISAHAAPGDCLLVDNTVPWRPGRFGHCWPPGRRRSGRWSTSNAAPMGPRPARCGTATSRSG
ncbi:conserved transmembrane domain protein [Mycobacterium kansasii]|uniref:Conserved transmembrane domain protein n=1 Tax=Mycobacterium kansasii TaxID=1768 RepID=A0A1V3WI47_MYCKA|nr:conserved transmembrane domain protein [Mycobacterium kansasii]